MTAFSVPTWIFVRERQKSFEFLVVGALGCVDCAEGSRVLRRVY